MHSIAKNEFSVLTFLVKNFMNRYTIRNIAKELKLSPAGAHTIVKKLEKNNILISEKLGTGLFHEINFKDKSAEYIALFVLLKYNDIKKIELKEIESDIRLAIFDNKNLLIVTDNRGHVEDFCSKLNINGVVVNEEEFLEKIKSKDKELLQIFNQGNVVYGEKFIIEIIKKGVR